MDDIFGFGSAGISSSDLARITTLENNEYKITYYEVVSGASGSLTIPTGATINAGEFGESGNAILSKIDGSGKPTYLSPKTAGGVVVTVSLNVSTGAWTASGTYTDVSVALIYSIKIKAIYYSNLTYANIIETIQLTDFPISQTITNGVTNKAPSEDAVFDALALKRSTTTEMFLFSGSFTTINLAASTTYYWSNMNGLAPTSTQSFSKFTFANNFTVTKIVLTCSQNINPSSVNTALYIRENATTDKIITTTLDLNSIGANTSKVFVYSGLNLSVTSGSDYEFKIVTPAMATTPTNCRWHIQVWGY